MNLQEIIKKTVLDYISESDPKVGTGKKPKNSDRRLYTDENPKDTVSVKFKTKQDIVDTLNKKSFKSKPHKRKSQIINLIHQRLRVALGRAKDPEVKKRLSKAFEYIELKKEQSKKKTEKMRENQVILIKKILKESEDDFSWVDTSEPELVRDDQHRYDIIVDVISKVKEYKGWSISQDRFDGVVYWWGVDGYTGMATPEWDKNFLIPVDISKNEDGDNVTLIRTPRFKYVIEVEDWYKNNYFELVYNILTDYINGEDVEGLIET
jgi:hypothetical protein